MRGKNKVTEPKVEHDTQDSATNPWKKLRSLFFSRNSIKCEERWEFLCFKYSVDR